MVKYVSTQKRYIPRQSKLMTDGIKGRRSSSWRDEVTLSKPIPTNVVGGITNNVTKQPDPTAKVSEQEQKPTILNTNGAGLLDSIPIPKKKHKAVTRNNIKFVV